jgi:3-oxoacyl-[acyl-carrier-protein] synthase II
MNHTKAVLQIHSRHHRRSRKQRRRVVVTGMGAISPMGNSLLDSWYSLLGGRSREEGGGNSWNSNRSRHCNSNSGDYYYNGITTLEEALVQHQNLSLDQVDREWNLAKTLPCQVVAPVQDLESAIQNKMLLLDDQNRKKTSRFVQLALIASEEAMEQANLLDWFDMDDHCHNNININMEYDDDEWDDSDVRKKRNRFGVCIGSGMSGVREIIDAWHTTNANINMNLFPFEDNHNDSNNNNKYTIGIKKLSPHFIPKVLTNSASGRVALYYGLRGPNLAPSTACAAGTHAIGDAYRAIQYGTADLMLAGGTEASIEPLGLAGFCRLRALSTKYNSTPELASRPFDTDRDGFVMGEGAAILVLEELRHAKSRGATILAELSGYGSSGDAYHITAPDEKGTGAERAMRMALAEFAAADIHRDNDNGDDGDDDRGQQRRRRHQVGYVNAHATSTPKGDEIEANVISRVFQRHHNNNQNHHRVSDGHEQEQRFPYVSSTKGATGHLLGAAGALEAAFTIMSLVDQTIPPTRHLNIEDHDRDDGRDTTSQHRQQCFSHVAGNTGMEIKDNTLQVAMSNSFGFGGTNASLVFSVYNKDNDDDDVDDDDMDD